MADNWYKVLELEFDPPVEDERVIQEKIDEKAKYWSINFNNFKNGAQYRAWHQNIPQIKKDMIGPANIRKQLAAEACAEVYGSVDKYIKTIGRKGHITSEEGEKIAKKEKLSIDVIKKRAAKLGVKWTDSAPQNYQATYEKYYKNKPQNAAAFDGMMQMLSSFNVDNLYDFLYAGTTIKNARNQSCDKLCQRAQELKKTSYYKQDSISGTGSKLCGQCELAFKDENSKDIYDRYLEYVKRKSVLDYAKSIAEISGELAKEQADEAIGQLTQILKNRELSEEVLLAFCKVEKIAYNVGVGGSSSANLKVCRCGCINDISDGRKVCKNCGLELEIICPKCGAKNDSNIKVCKCGFKLSNIDKAVALCELAELAVESLDFAAAEAHLSDADKLWPNSSKVLPIRKRLEEYRTRVGMEVSKMRTAVNAKQYCEAKKYYSHIQSLFPSYSDQLIEQEIDSAIAKAQQYLKAAKEAKTQRDILENCALAYDNCSDLPGVKELMPAPDPVTGFSVSANPVMRCNIISWNSQNDKSVRYVVVRSTNGWIRHVSDGDVVFRGSSAAYTDKEIAPGAAYYYNVFSERAGIYSGGAKGDFREIYNFFEVAGLNAAASDASVNLSWEHLPANASAEIYQLSTNGSESHIASCSAGSYLINGLQNDQIYRYRVALAYLIGGRKQITKGCVVSATPTRLPQAIDRIRIIPAENGQFNAIWVQQDPGEVRLFGSKTKPEFAFGDVVSVSALEQSMTAIQMRPLSAALRKSLKPNESGASFQYNGSEVLFVTAVIIKSGTAVFGSTARASTGEIVKIKAIRPVNGKINIYLDPPKQASGFVVLYRHDQFPADISDVKTVRKYIPLKQYLQNSAIVLDVLEEKKYYFSVFAEFTYDGEKDYSIGAEYLFDHSAKQIIVYSISLTKKFLSESSLVLEFETDKPTWTLPDIDIVSAVGNTPMFKASARLFYEIPSQIVRGTLQVRIPLPKTTPKNTYIKAFFKDEMAQAGNQLKLKLKSNYKIT